MVEWRNLLIMGLGAGLKGTVAGWVQKFIPELGADMAAIVGGLLLHHFGKDYEWLRLIGTGILIGGVGQFSEDIVAKFVPKAEGQGGSRSHSSPEPTTYDIAQMIARGEY